MRTFKFYILFSILAIGEICNAGKVSKFFSMRMYDVVEEPFYSDTTIYTEISHKNFQEYFSTGDNGAPRLPMKYAYFAVPLDAYDFKISTTQTFTESKQLANPIFPVQDYLIGESLSTTFFDESIYYADEFYPASNATIVSDGFLGSNHIVTVAINPITYNPISQTLKTTSFIITLEYKTGAVDDKDNNHRPIRPINDAQINYDMELTKSFVSNPNDVRSLSSKDFSNKPKTTFDFPVYNYCIITNRKLKPAFDRLVAWKQLKGYNAGVVCIEDILSCLEFQNGDDVSNINDDAGKLRSYLQYAYKNGGKFVLFGGDNTIVPIRYGCNTDNPSGLVGLIPTDSYFSDLNSNWDSDSDKFYGEKHNDKIDFFPELFVGRLLCENAIEVANFTEKLITYEKNPGNGDFSYLTKAFITQSDDMQDMLQGDKFSRELSKGFGIRTIFSEIPSYNAPNPSFPTGTDCINEMNKNYGLFAWFGHGDPGGVCTKSNYVNKNGHFGILANSQYLGNHINEGGCNRLDYLLNAKFPTIAISPSCSLAPFDTIPGYGFRQNMATSFTTGGNYGGPAFVGNTRVAYIDSSYELVIAVTRNLLHNSDKIGKAVALAKFQTRKGFSDKLKQNLVGCPELELWTSLPQKFGDIAITRSDKQLSLTGADLTGSSISFFDYTTGTRNIFKSDSTVCTIANANPSGAIMIYKHNYIPYFTSLEMQNGVFDDANYIYATTVSIGRSINSNRTYGDFRFRKGDVATIDAEQQICIYDGTIFENGCDITLKSNECVNVNGGLIRKGASVTIVAPSVNIIKDFEIEKGGILTLTTK